VFNKKDNMLIIKYHCKECDKGYLTENEAENCEKKPIRFDNIPLGYMFKEMPNSPRDAVVVKKERISEEEHIMNYAIFDFINEFSRYSFRKENRELLYDILRTLKCAVS
jgi:hypothetical protein